MTEYQDVVDFIRYSDVDTLERLVTDIQAEIGRRFVVTVREVYKACGKPGCKVCGGYDKAHGPYLVATWSEYGKQKQKSLGRRFYQGEFVKMAEHEPEPADFRLSKAQVKNWRDSGKELHSHKLTDEQFAQEYGVYPWEDTFDRPRNIYYDKAKFEQARAKFEDEQKVKYSRWTSWGIGTLHGVVFLDHMLYDGHKVTMA